MRRLASLLRPRREAGSVVLLPVDRIEDNPVQPRGHVETRELHALAASIRHFGVIVPILVREDRDRYVLVAGQRRLAACRLLGLDTVPALVRRLSPEVALEAGYLENLHRVPLRDVEEARVVERLRTEWGEPARDEVAARLGLDPERARHNAELLDHPVLLREAMVLGLITPAHSQLLRSIRDRAKVLSTIRRIHREGLSPEQTSRLLSA